MDPTSIVEKPQDTHFNETPTRKQCLKSEIVSLRYLKKNARRNRQEDSLPAGSYHHGCHDAGWRHHDIMRCIASFFWTPDQ